MILAQLADLLPQWMWYLLLYGGMIAPGLGFCIYAGSYQTRTPKRLSLVLLNYVITLPLFFPVVHGSGSINTICSFFLLMPFGFLIGLFVVLPVGRREPESRGFEVIQSHDDLPS